MSARQRSDDASVISSAKKSRITQRKATGATGVWSAGRRPGKACDLRGIVKAQRVYRNSDFDAQRQSRMERLAEVPLIQRFEFGATDVGATCRAAHHVLADVCKGKPWPPTSPPRELQLSRRSCFPDSFRSQFHRHSRTCKGIALGNRHP